MTDSVYRKDGRSLRLEIESGTTHALDLRERGEAVERNGVFECTTLSGAPMIGPEELHPIPGDLVDSLLAMDDSLERATFLTGASSHAFHSDEGERQWHDQVARIHLSIVNRRHQLRCEVDRSDRVFSRDWLAELLELQQALTSCRPGLEVSGGITLEPAVSAAILAYMFARNLLPAPSLIQAPRPDEHDGKGDPVASCRLPIEPEDLPWFRPSYRTPPRRVPHGIDLVSDRVGSESAEWRAIALIGDPIMEEGVLLARCLLSRDEDATDATVEIARWSDEVVIVSGPEQWFPLLAGVWGRRMIFRGVVTRGTAV